MASNGLVANMVVSIPEKVVYSLDNQDHILDGTQLRQVFEWQPKPNAPKRYVVEIPGGHCEIDLIHCPTPITDTEVPKLERLLVSLLHRAQTAESELFSARAALESYEMRTRDLKMTADTLKKKNEELEATTSSLQRVLLKKEEEISATTPTEDTSKLKREYLMKIEALQNQNRKLEATTSSLQKELARKEQEIASALASDELSRQKREFLMQIEALQNRIRALEATVASLQKDISKKDKELASAVPSDEAMRQQREYLMKIEALQNQIRKLENMLARRSAEPSSGSEDDTSRNPYVPLASPSGAVLSPGVERAQIVRSPSFGLPELDLATPWLQYRKSPFAEWRRFYVLAFAEVLRFGNLETLQSLVSANAAELAHNNSFIDPNGIGKSSSSRSIASVAVQLTKAGYEPLCQVIKGGSLETLQYLVVQGFWKSCVDTAMEAEVTWSGSRSFLDRLLDEALVCGHFHIVAWLLSEHKIRLTPDSLGLAFQSKATWKAVEKEILLHSDLADYRARANDFTSADFKLINCACTYGRLEYLEWMDSQKRPGTTGSRLITKGGALNVNVLQAERPLAMLKWISEKLEWTPAAHITEDCNNYVAAIENGNLKVVKWFVGAGMLPLGNGNQYLLLRAAVRSGSVEMVRYLVENGCSIKSKENEDYACSSLAECGKPEMMQCLKELGFNLKRVIDGSFLERLVSKGHLTLLKSCLDYLSNPRLLSKIPLRSLMQLAVRSASVEMIEYLDKQGLLKGVDAEFSPLLPMCAQLAPILRKDFLHMAAWLLHRFHLPVTVPGSDGETALSAAENTMLGLLYGIYA